MQKPGIHILPRARPDILSIAGFRPCNTGRAALITLQTKGAFLQTPFKGPDQREFRKILDKFLGQQAKMPSPMDIREWHSQKSEGYLCSTNPKFLDPNAINAVFGSDMIWWARALPEESMKTMLDNCLCLGLYKLQPEADESGPNRTMVGFCRVITDYVTFGYLTDVFVVKEHQGKGLGRWMMECLNEVLDSWPELRRVLLIAGDPHAMKMYTETLGVYDMRAGPARELFIFEKKGPGQLNRPPRKH